MKRATATVAGIITFAAAPKEVSLVPMPGIPDGARSTILRTCSSAFETASISTASSPARSAARGTTRPTSKKGRIPSHNPADYDS